MPTNSQRFGFGVGGLGIGVQDLGLKMREWPTVSQGKLHPDSKGGIQRPAASLPASRGRESDFSTS